MLFSGNVFGNGLKVKIIIHKQEKHYNYIFNILTANSQMGENSTRYTVNLKKKLVKMKCNFKSYSDIISKGFVK